MKHPVTLPTAASRLSTPTHFDKSARNAISKAINPLVADAFALFVKTKNYHWHVSGSHYRDYHLLLDEQASQLFDMIDVLAERVRKVGGTTIHSVSEISELQRVKDDNDSFVAPKAMIQRLLEENKSLVTRMKVAHEICAQYKDVATTSLLETFIDETERRVWFLFETQSE
ncbi:MAG TPA: DNA starvation/stationary phase protection protein [Gammaproteobacteria bacterium]|nr:DNA starvation/stationary phase protection protein [Gammaproteobacteria bacterium]